MPVRSVLVCIWMLLALAGAATASARETVSPELLADVFPGAARLGPIEGNPPAATAYDAARAIGFLFFSHDVIGSIGFSGKPVDIAIGLRLDGTIAGARLIEHHEPILILGIGDPVLHRFVAAHRGIDIRAPVTVSRAAARDGVPDAVSGATVSSLLMREAILRASRAIARSRGIVVPAGAQSVVDRDRFERREWPALRAEGAVAQMRLIGSDVLQRLEQGAGGPVSVTAPRDSLFIDLYAALATPAMIGRNLLGDRIYADLVSPLGDADHAVLLAANGLYSFKGTGFARSGTFDRVQIVQADRTLRLQASGHRRIESLAPGMPSFREIGLFVLPAASGFDAAAPWRVELLVEGQRDDGRPQYANFAFEYRLPPGLLRRAAAVPDAIDPSALWQQVWRDRAVRIAILTAALVLLTVLLFMQDRLAHHSRLFRRLRFGFLVFTLVWLGWYAAAQVSVVNILTFTQALLTGFRWDFFLLDPLVFLLWTFVAVALLFWGRGVFCGWLCPFGALQELLHRLGRALKIRTFRPSFVLHERLAAVKYAVFLLVFALSLNLTDLALATVEVEPFKTAVARRFDRPWPFVFYALALLAVGLVVERAFCRYLCPLGAALAIPARLRLFEWLKRKKQCGAECQVCASRCPVQAIHPDGHINPNECIHCFNCQMLYYDATTCPPLKARRERREARSAALAQRQGALQGP
ncbi:MAG: NosR/NirI family protein [Alphaproteobacteria bacterium]|nr:NosR/NirI family protein [Alphaproteobacteria bacterium]